MQISIVRDLALVVAGNSLIAGGWIPRFWPDNNVFRFSRECVFLDADHSVIAPDPNAWLERIHKDYDGLWLDYVDRQKLVPDRMTVGFVGGGRRWLIGTVRGDTTELWEGGDQLGDKKAADHKIWNSDYVRIDADWKKTRDAGKTAAEMKAALDDTLRKIGAFARAQKRDNFARSFEEARAALTHYARRDPMLDDVGAEARQLWSAVGSAWVFGGMGSWNDLGFEGKDNEIYEQLSETLYVQLNEAVATIANSTWPDKAPAKEGTIWWQRLFS